MRLSRTIPVLLAAVAVVPAAGAFNPQPEPPGFGWITAASVVPDVALTQWQAIDHLCTAGNANVIPGFGQATAARVPTGPCRS
jgi:hypothetical protein